MQTRAGSEECHGRMEPCMGSHMDPIQGALWGASEQRMRIDEKGIGVGEFLFVMNFIALLIQDYLQAIGFFPAARHFIDDLFDEGFRRPVFVGRRHAEFILVVVNAKVREEAFFVRPDEHYFCNAGSISVRNFLSHCFVFFREGMAQIGVIYIIAPDQEEDG